MTSHKSVEKMLDTVRRAVGQCEADEKTALEALVEEAEGWKMRLEELEDEPEDE